MKTLEEAVAELEAMEDPMEVLKSYPNDSTLMTESICMCCPVAAFLKERTGSTPWVGPDSARLSMTSKDHISFSKKLTAVVAELDLARFNARHAHV
jgi:hypothetical protein